MPPKRRNVRPIYRGRYDYLRPLTSPSLLPVEIEVEKEELTLLEENTLTLNGVDQLPAGVLTNVKFELQIDGEPEWYEIQSGAETEFTGKARVAGTFNTRATIIINGSEAEITGPQIEVQFPNHAEILAGAGVKARMDQAWQDTKNSTQDDSRGEIGYYITINTNTEAWGIANYTVGAKIKDNQGPPKVDLGGRPLDIPEIPTPLDKPTYAVGHFHTHPVEYYRDEQIDFGDPPGTVKARIAGESPDDIVVVNVVNCPGFVYDYVGTTIGGTSGLVPFGHPINAAAKIYEYNHDETPPDRRPSNWEY